MSANCYPQKMQLMSVADPEVRPLGVLDTIMRKMTNNNSKYRKQKN